MQGWGDVAFGISCEGPCRITCRIAVWLLQILLLKAQIRALRYKVLGLWLWAYVQHPQTCTRALRSMLKVLSSWSIGFGASFCILELTNNLLSTLNP